MEAVRLVDHYQFRVAMRHATSSRPLELKRDEARWCAPYYDEMHATFIGAFFSAWPKRDVARSGVRSLWFWAMVS